MSENSLRAYEILVRRFSNVPPLEQLSEKSQDLLDKTGAVLGKLNELDAQMQAEEKNLYEVASQVESNLAEELGSLVPIVQEREPQMQILSMDQLMQLMGGGPLPDVVDAEFEDEDPEPTIH